MHSYAKKPIQKAANLTGIPDNKKKQVEETSGESFDDVRVHYNSDKPAQLRSYAYTQGNDVYVGPGQENHLMHELGHVVQQKRGEVKPTETNDGISINTDNSLEKDADNMWSSERIRRHERTALGAPSGIVQKRPMEFKFSFPDSIKSVALLRSWSNWGKVEKSTEKYASLKERDVLGRAKALKTLSARIKAYNSSKDDTEEANAKRTERVSFGKGLEGMIKSEFIELKPFIGSLDVENKIGTVSEDPLISKRAGSDNWLMFINQSTPMFNKRGIKEKDVNKTYGKVANEVQFDVDATVSTRDYYKVVQENKSNAKDYYIDIKPAYVAKSATQRVIKVEALKGHKYKESKALLFPHSPVIEDIKQGNLGNCYLHAAIAGVIKNDGDHFLNHMKDNSNGTVTVKMYDDDKNEVYVTVKKTVVRDDRGKSTFAGDTALWVPIYEKAYVAAGFHGSKGRIIKNSYGMTEGGFIDIAAKHITGKDYEEKGTSHFISRTDKVPLENRIKGRNTDGDNLLANSIKHFKSLPYSKHEQLKLLEDDYKKLMEPILIKYSGFVRKPGDTVEKMTHEALKDIITSNLQDLLNDIDSVISSDSNLNANTDLKAMKHLFAYSASESILRSLSDERLINSERGYGKYTDAAIRVFDYIKEKIDNKSEVFMGTKQVLPGDQASGAGHSAGESIVKGVAGGHAYTVIDYAPKSYKAGDNKTIAIKIRNPWGKTGRKYRKPDGSDFDFETGETLQQGSLFREDDAAGEFWLELSEFTRYFASISARK